MRRNPTWLGAVGVPGALAAMFLACTAPAPVDDLGPSPAQENPPRGGDAAPVQIEGADAAADAGPACTTVPPNNRCGLDPQCGCGPDETCDVTSPATGATSCVTAGSATLGRPCATTGDCLAGLTCMYGACRPYCSTARSKCTVAGTDLCVEILDTSNNPEPNVRVCTITCDPREPQAVCGTNACLWFPTYYSPEKVSDCNFAGKSQALGSCTTDSDCAAGLACIIPTTNAQAICERWCRLGVAGDCPTGFTCTDVYGANAPVGSDGMKEGVCNK